MKRTGPRIFGVMVVRNEADRYLREAVASLRQVVDGLLVYDDGSNDRSREIAHAEGALVLRRPTTVPPMAEHEGRCREAAWKLVNSLGPDLGDWVVSVDADEFLTTAYPDRRAAMLHAVEQANEEGAFAIGFRVNEVYGWREDRPLVRIDGDWGSAKSIRMMRWGLSTAFQDIKVGSGSVPGKAHRVLLAEAERTSLVHMGYARDKDRAERLARHERNGSQRPKLVEWAGELPVGP